MKLRFGCFLLALAIAGCFYPPAQHPVPENRDQLTLKLPFDLAWDAVHTVIAKNRLQIIAEDPDNGIIESQAATGFTVEDADCGKVRGIVGKYRAEPDAGSSAVYNFAVKPHGNEASVVSVQAVFTSSVHIPMHPMSGENCVSRGVQEKRLLKQIAEQARKGHRPEFKAPSE